jgi:hypothetical protein
VGSEIFVFVKIMAGKKVKYKDKRERYIQIGHDSQKYRKK